MRKVYTPVVYLLLFGRLMVESVFGQVAPTRMIPEQEHVAPDRAVFDSDRVVSVSRLRHKPISKAVAALTRASALAAAGAWKASALELQKAVEIDPGYSEAHGNLGAVYLHLGRIVDGARELRRAIALDPGSSNMRANLAIALIHLGRDDDAQKEAMSAVALDGSNPVAHYLLGVLAANNASQRLNAIKHLEYAGRFLPDGHKSLAELYRFLGERDRAEEESRLYQDAISRGRGSMRHSALPHP
jgi:tetratricopeptide (TPR) repeat protein